MGIIFKADTTPVAVYPTQRGMKGLITLKADPRGMTEPNNVFNVAVLAIQGGKEPNVQLTANLNNEAYYALFGDKMTRTIVTCADLPGTCGKKSSSEIMRLRDAVTLMNEAVDNGVLPTITVTYASGGSASPVTIRGYLVGIPFALQEQYRGTLTLIIAGYTR